MTAMLMVANNRSQDIRPRVSAATSEVLQILGVAAAYWLSAQIGLEQQLVRGQVTPLWPPTGVALVSLFLLGVRKWPGISLGALLVNAPLGPSLPAVVAIATGNTLAPLCAYWMLRRVDFRTELNRLRDGLALVLLGAMVGMLVSATIGSVALLSAGAVPVGSFVAVWSVWWTGDAMGVLVIAPLLLILRSARWPRGVSVLWWIKAAVLLATTVIVMAAVTRASADLLFLMFPLLIWAALTFRLGGVTIFVLIVSGFAIHAAAIGSGPFAGQDLLVKMITLQAFNGCAALTGLLLAAITAERNASYQILERAHQQLSNAATEQKALQHQLAHRAMHDALTGLPNRVVLAERLEWMLGRESGDIQAVLLVDLDGFKDINDTYGHPIGDEILVDVSRRLVTAAPAAAAVVARLGGDEFAVIVETVTGQQQALAQAEHIIDVMHRPFDIDGQQMFLSTSIGLLTIGPDQRPMSPTEALRDADVALYAAKETGRDRVVPFDPRLRAYRLERMRISTGLRRALDHGDLLLHYQPIIELATGGIVGMEALARWRLPNGEMISPGQFIPVAEETGLVNIIGARVLRQACHELHRWHDAFGVFVAVNVSARQFDDPDFAGGVIAELDDYGLPPASLVLELTETSLIGDLPQQQGLIQLRRLHEHGVRIAIDDFGTGYSSLAYLSGLPIDIVKLDRLFIQHRNDPAIARSDWAFTGAIVQAIECLDLKVIAEGVETPEQARALSASRCHFAQGYLYSRPAPATEIDQMLRAGPRPKTTVPST